MLVGVLVEGGVAQRLVELAERVGEVLVVFAQHRARLGAELLFGVLEVLETVCFEFEDLLEVFGCEYGVIDGAVVGRVGVWLLRRRLA